MSRILGMMCVRNEGDRYLAHVLDWHSFLDGVFVYDDQSTDDTVACAREWGASQVIERTNDVPSFMQHEGEFRQAAWEQFEISMHPQLGDWVLSIDADEFWEPAYGSPRERLDDAVCVAKAGDSNGVTLNVVEVFDVDREGKTWRRTDGFWGTITATRLFAYQLGGRIANREMGCGSVPTYVSTAGHPTTTGALVHYGYATPDDRQAKFLRYSNHRNNGHNPQHIASIIEQPFLTPWGSAHA